MIVGVKDFRSGETLRKRVSSEDARVLRNLAGFTPIYGAAIPDKLPTRISTTQLCAETVLAATMALTGDLVTTATHGYAVGTAIQFGSTTGGVTVGKTYYVKTVPLTTTFTFSATNGGATFDITANGSNTVWAVIPPQVPAILRTATDSYLIARDEHQKIYHCPISTGVWAQAYKTPNEMVPVIEDSAPQRLGTLVAIPTGGSDAKIVTYEPEYPNAGDDARSLRPLSLKAPTDYDATATLGALGLGFPHVGITNCTMNNVGDTVTLTGHGLIAGQSIAFATTIGGVATGTRYFVLAAGLGANDFQFSTTDGGAAFVITADGLNDLYAHPQRQLFDLASPATGFVAVGAGCSTASLSTDYQDLTFGFSSLASTQSFTWNITDLLLTNKRFLVMDFVLKYTHSNPTERITGSSSLVNNDQSPATSGFELVLHKDDACTNTEAQTIRRMEIPRLSADGNVNRVVFALGSLVDGLTVKGISIRTNASYVAPAANGHFYTLWVYSQEFSPANWAFKGNAILPAATFLNGAWYDALPPDPGSNWQSASAVVLETFPESFANFTPDHPLLKWRYHFFGRDQKTTDYYRKMISNPSVDSATCLADPWRKPEVGIAGDAWPLNASSNNMIDDYGLYLTHVVYYRAIYDGLGEDEETGELGVWSDFDFWGSATTAVLTRPEDDGSYTTNSIDAPEVSPVNRDYADSARYLVIADGRAYGLSQTYSVATDAFLRPLSIQVSNFDDYAGFPTTPSEDFIETDGTEILVVTPDTYVIRGALTKDDVKYVYTNNGFYELIGRDSMGGWQFQRRDSIGCVSAKTIADCRSQIIWHDGGHFYSYDGGLATPISQESIDSTLIDFTQAHGWVFSKERYVGFCYYNDTAQSTPWCLMIYDLKTGSWRRRHSTAYQLAGICVSDAAGTVYGLTHDGDVVSIFGGTTDYGSGAVTYTIDTQYLEWPDGNEHHTSHLVLEAITAEASVNLTLSFYTQGRLNESDLNRTLSIVSTRTHYGKDDLNVNLTGDAVRIVMTYTGATPPEIHLIGVAADDKPREGA